MFFIKLADINIGISCKYQSLKRFCTDYLTDSEKADFTVFITDEDILKERNNARGTYSDPYLASICIYRAICQALPRFGAFMLHSAVVKLDGAAYAFSAPSGTGKSTHASLWVKHFGDRAEILNGDKPILRFKGKKLFVYGSPWCGKEGQNKNDSAPLEAICFIERGNINKIKKIEPAEAIPLIFSQILLPETESSADLIFPILDQTLTTVPCFKLSCNISDEAVTVAYNEMKKNILA